jgi:hypothetical protein
MAEEPKLTSWWQTLPGILTATAGIITALTGLLVVLYQAGLFQPGGKDANHSYTASPATEAGSQADTKTAPLRQSNSQPTGAGQVPVATGQNLAGKAAAPSPAKRINLFAPENGVQLLVASNDYWKNAIDGKEDNAQIYNSTGKEAVFGFQDDQAATFDTFTMLIGETSDYNVKDFELLAGNDTPTGTFESIGKFQTQNVKLFKTPYQEFEFPPVTAKYLKVKLLSTYSGVAHPAVWEYQLFGSLK